MKCAALDLGVVTRRRLWAFLWPYTPVSRTLRACSPLSLPSSFLIGISEIVKEAGVSGASPSPAGDGLRAQLLLCWRARRRRFEHQRFHSQGHNPALCHVTEVLCAGLGLGVGVALGAMGARVGENASEKEQDAQRDANPFTVRSPQCPVLVVIPSQLFEKTLNWEKAYGECQVS
ncbi:hypothetical protein B0H19DRAFT_1274984 [Mycena capillaripes]|nr:hypothetical protein B0H19DRAFT_1274984 [Mycena capillaripes]